MMNLVIVEGFFFLLPCSGLSFDLRMQGLYFNLLPSNMIRIQLINAFDVVHVISQLREHVICLCRL